MTKVKMSLPLFDPRDDLSFLSPKLFVIKFLLLYPRHRLVDGATTSGFWQQ